MIQVNFNTVAELVALAEAQHVPVHEIVLAREMHDRERSRGEVLQEMLKNWQVMQESIVRGIQNTERSLSGMTGGDAKKLYAYRASGYMGEAAIEAAACAVGISEVNAVMGRIVACPTAGSCGIVPAALYAAKKQRRASGKHHLKGPPKRTAADDRAFESAMRALLDEIVPKNEER